MYVRSVMIPRIGSLVCALAVFTCSLAPSPASGQTRDPAAARTLNGHTFIPSSQIDDPFITTLIRTQTGGGFATKVTRDIENEVVDSLIDALVGDLAFLALEFEYQHAVTDWLALSASASGAARIGTGAQSVLAEGVTSMFGFKLRATARVLQTEKWLLSTSLRFQPSTQYRLDILTFAKRVIEEGKITEDNSVIIRSHGVGGAAGLGGAYAPKPWLGFVFAGNAGYADTFSDEGRSDLAWDVGGLASFDLNPLRGIPLGLLLSVKQDAFVVDNSDITDKVMAFGWGVAYTGREDFSLSLETSHLRVPLTKSDQTITATLVGFNLRYYF
jgi:hypothetical protein